MTEEEKLNSFIAELKRRYPTDEVKETSLMSLSEKNPDLRFDLALSLCRKIHHKTLKPFLKEQGILLAKKSQNSDIKVIEEPIQKSVATVDENTVEEITVEDIEESVENVDLQEPDIAVNADYHLIEQYDAIDDERIIRCINRDIDSYIEYITEKQINYGFEEIYRFLRTLYRKHITMSLKKYLSVSYAEYLIVQLVNRKEVEYWKDLLLEFLSQNFYECKDGVLVFDRSSYAYDSNRQICKISTPLYYGNMRVTNMQVAERYSGNISVHPCYVDKITSCDTVVVSNQKEIGKLNHTVFSSKGLGAYLFPLLVGNTVTITNIGLTTDDFPYIYFDVCFE